MEQWNEKKNEAWINTPKETLKQLKTYQAELIASKDEQILYLEIGD